MCPLLRLTAGAVAATLLFTAARPLPRATTPVPVSRATGVTFKYRITSSAADKKQREARSMFATVRMQDGNVRMDYLEGMTPTGQKGGYVIMRGDTRQFIIVNDKDKQAMIMSADLFGSGLGAMLNNPMIRMTISNTDFRFKDLGAGEPILGYRTRKVRTWYTSTIETKVLMMNNRITTSDSSDQWIASGIDVDPKNLENWARSFTAGVKSTNPELAAEVTKYANEYGRSGMALKSITWSTQTDKKGKVQADTLTMEVTDLTTGAIDAAVFEIPQGYEVVDLAKSMAEAKAEADAEAKTDAKAGADKKEEKPSAKHALKQGLGGLLKKKPPM